MTGLQAGWAILGRGVNWWGARYWERWALRRGIHLGAGQELVALPESGQWKSHRSACSKWSANRL